MSPHGGSGVLILDRTTQGNPVSARWGFGLMRRLSAPKRVFCRSTDSNEEVVQDAEQSHRMLERLSRHRVKLIVQYPDDRQFGTAMLRTQAGHNVLMDCSRDELALAGNLPAHLNVIAPGERGLQFFTVHGLSLRAGAVPHAPGPDTDIRAQSSVLSR